MRQFEYQTQYIKLLTPDIVTLLSRIHEYKGEQMLFIAAKSDTLTKLEEMAKIQSTDASNRIEGISTENERLKKLVMDKTMPHTRNEQEIAGYRDVLASIHESHDYIPPKPTIILQLHRDLYKFSGMSYGGSYKTADNIIAETDASGNRRVRFQPVSAWETPAAIEALCQAYAEEIGRGEIDPLLLIPMFVLDFLCIYPFNDGNGRMSRLLTLLLLYRAGYIVGKYISIEKLIEESKDTYYEALKSSSTGWHEGTNDYAPFVRYMLGVIAAAYREFSQRVQLIAASNLSKPQRIREVIRSRLGKITSAEIMQLCPDISKMTVQRTLKELQVNNDIIKIGGGRYTSYVWNQDKE